jgi:hypothetical protein
MRSLRTGRSQFFSLQLNYLPGFKDPPFRLSDSPFKLRPRDLSFCQFPAPRLKISP